MARFRGTLEGCRGSASRLGSANSGLRVTARGWNIGVSIDLLVNDKGKDAVRVYVDGGSNGRMSSKLVYSGEECQE